MSERNIKLFLNDIFNSVQKIRRYTKEKSYEEFINNELIIDGVIRNLEVIGEAVKNIPAGFRKKYSNIEWKKIAGLRDILIHKYFGIDYELLWDIVQNKIPFLDDQIKVILKELEKSEEV